MLSAPSSFSQPPSHISFLSTAHILLPPSRSTMAAASPLCRCAVPAVLRTSWTDANPGRRFFGCANYRGANACNYFRWIDPPLKDNIKRLVLALHKRIREVERRNDRSSFV
ncbi:unnamed protein product [Linum tenue]|uniref:GRF-type domain-containing protein n=1 Tax=Linum tenue TaxID=586396 RepID=A0AAV0MIE5_9ROSI|nr:unnamed protein product [Linum tenue]